MDLGPHSVQIFVSLVVVLAAAGVALVCDLLKGNNEHLRELAVELKVRHEEAERRATVMEKRGRRIPDMSAVKPVKAMMPVARVEAAPEVPPTEQTQVPLPKVAAAAAAAVSGTRPERRRREMSPAVAAVAQAAAAIVNGNREQFASVAAAGEPFKLYFLVGEPTQVDLRPAYESALSILAKARAFGPPAPPEQAPQS